MTDKKAEKLMLKLEASLFSYARWVNVDELKDVLKTTPSAVSKALLELQKKYESGFAFQIEKNSEGQWKMSLKPEYEDLAEELISGIEIPKPMLKVLSLIAYEQPITKTGLNRLMGRSILEELEFLYKHKFINYEKKGIGKYYRVTSKFYEYFKLEGRDEFLKKANDSMHQHVEEAISDSESEM